MEQVVCRNQIAQVLKVDKRDSRYKYLLRLEDGTLTWAPRRAFTTNSSVAVNNKKLKEN